VKKRPQKYGLLISFNQLGTSNLAGTKATGTYINCLVRTFNNSLNSSDVGLPRSVGLAVRVRYIVSKYYAFSAYITFSHFLHLH